jgi:tetratricopeptide (TPR) repeat protein
MSELDRLVKNRLNFTILIVDDKPNMRKTVRNMLRVLGFNSFREAEDGLDAYRKLEAETVDLILCDWNMPRMNGYEFLLRVRESDKFRHLPFLMVTGEVEAGTVAQAIESDVDGYVIKPFVPKILEEKLIEVLTKRLEPSAVDQQLDQAEDFMEHGRFEEAHTALNQAEALLPRSPRVHYARGRVFEGEGRPEQAIEAYNTARQTGPRFVKARERLSQLYKDAGRTEDMLAVLREAVEISPNQPERQTELGKALLNAGRVQEAKQAFGSAMRLDPDNAKRKTDIGESYLSQGLSAEAEVAFRAAIETDPKQVYIYNRLGIAFRRQKKYKEAIDNYKRALELQPRDEGLHFNLARAYLSDQNEKQAANSLKDALGINPGFQEARSLLIKLQSED